MTNQIQPNVYHASNQSWYRRNMGTRTVTKRVEPESNRTHKTHSVNTATLVHKALKLTK
jgi:hypothetical protein